MNESIAVLLTTHNRKDKTVECLTHLYNNNNDIDTFLVDDMSSDGTDKTIRNMFPKVNIILGNGNLFWNQGMRLAWKNAVENKEYDFYLLLNDDTNLDNNAIDELLYCYKNIKNEGIIVGSCRENNSKNIFSYGGRNNNGPVIPNGEIKTCEYINGNIVLISSHIYSHLGNLSNDYTHAMGDIDYGLRAIKSGFNCYITRFYIGSCENNKTISDFCNPNVSLKKRLESLYSPKGLNLKEYIIFRKKFWNNRWFLFVIKAYIRTLFPRIYNKFKRI